MRHKGTKYFHTIKQKPLISLALDHFLINMDYIFSRRLCHDSLSGLSGLHKKIGTIVWRYREKSVNLHPKYNKYVRELKSHPFRNMKRKLLLAGVLLATQLLGVKAEVDPNFYVYICFGQSNMEGNAKAESVDQTNIDKRFRLLATCNYDNPKRTLGNWYDAKPPLVNPVGGLGPTDYFGRTMVAALPAEVKIGVIPVAMGGSPIEMFDKDKYAKKLSDNPNEWWAQIAKNNYGGNPYKRIIDMAKKAQEVGVIKGILLHQGCSNNGDPNWPNMVKKIYNDMLKDLGLAADTVPLFVGETLRQENGGACYGHNTQVNRMPKVVPTSHVVSSEGLPGNGQDPWHFNAVGYRIFGKRYAFEALKLMGKELKADPEYNMGSTLKKFYTVKSINIDKDIYGMPGNSQKFAATAKYADNHTEDISTQLDIDASGADFVEITDGVMLPTKEGTGTIDVAHTDFLNQETKATVNLDVKFFPFSKTTFTKLSGTLTYNEAERSAKINAGGQAGWAYNVGADMSAYKYLVVKLKEQQTCNAQVRVYNKNTVSGTCYKDTINDRTTVVIDLQNMPYDNSGHLIDPSKVTFVSFKTVKAGTLYIDDVFLTNDDPENLTGINAARYSLFNTNHSLRTLDGRRMDARNPRPGIYLRDGKKVVVK